MFHPEKIMYFIAIVSYVDKLKEMAKINFLSRRKFCFLFDKSKWLIFCGCVSRTIT